MSAHTPTTVEQIPHVAHILTRIRPRRILDVYPAGGVYGLLARELIGPDKVDALVPAPSWRPNIERLERIFDDVYPFELTESSFARLGEYDLVLAVNVLEYVDPELGEIFLERCGRDGVRYMLIATACELDPDQHVAHYPPDDIGPLADTVGARIVESVITHVYGVYLLEYREVTT